MESDAKYNIQKGAFVMKKDYILSVLIAFILGILISLLFQQSNQNGRYVSIGNGRILDTRKGIQYALPATNKRWIELNRFD